VIEKRKETDDGIRWAEKNKTEEQGSGKDGNKIEQGNREEKIGVGYKERTCHGVHSRPWRKQKIRKRGS